MIVFFFNDTATTEIYTLSLHDALPISGKTSCALKKMVETFYGEGDTQILLLSYTNRAVDEICKAVASIAPEVDFIRVGRDRKSTRLNSSHANISYAVFCLKKKTSYYNS